MNRALVISANSGLGKCICTELLSKGYDLDLTVRSLEKGESLKSDLGEEFDHRVGIHVYDVLDLAKAKTLVQTIQHPDAVFICTGIMGDHERAIESEDEMLRILDTNFRGIAVLVNLLVRKMKSKGGIIAGVSSVAGERGRKGNFYYGSAKKALTTLFDGYRHYFFGSELKFVTVIPGYIKTEMLKEKTPGFLTSSPEKAAKAIVQKSITGKGKFYVGPIWYWVMMVIRNIPERILLRMNI